MTEMTTKVGHRRAALRIGAALGGAASLAAGCSSSPSAAGGITMVCVATDEWYEANTSEFAEATGIGADCVRLANGEAAARLEAGEDTAKFDVWHGGLADGFVAAARRGLFEPDNSPAAAVARTVYNAADGSWIGINVGVLGFSSNRAVLAGLGVPASAAWQELLYPRPTKNVSVAHPTTSGTGLSELRTQVVLADGEQAAGLNCRASLPPDILQYPVRGLGRCSRGAGMRSPPASQDRAATSGLPTRRPRCRTGAPASTSSTWPTTTSLPLVPPSPTWSRSSTPASRHRPQSDAACLCSAHESRALHPILNGRRRMRHGRSRGGLDGFVRCGPEMAE